MENFSMCINPAADLFIFEKFPSRYNTHEDDTQHSLTFLEGNDFNIDLLDLGIPQNYAIVADSEEVMVENTQKLIGLLERSQTEHLTFILADHYALSNENYIFSSKRVPYNAFQGSGPKMSMVALSRRNTEGLLTAYPSSTEFIIKWILTSILR